MPAIAKPRRSSNRLLAVAADPYRDGRFLNRLGQKYDIREAVIFAIERWMLTRPEFAKRFDVFIGHAAALRVGRCFQIFKFLFHPADSQPDDHPALRENVETGEH